MAVDYMLNDRPIKSWIDRNGWGARERLCRQLGLSSKWLSLIRNGERLPRGDHLIALADALGVSVEDLVIRKPKKPRS